MLGEWRLNENAVEYKMTFEPLNPHHLQRTVLDRWVLSHQSPTDICGASGAIIHAVRCLKMSQSREGRCLTQNTGEHNDPSITLTDVSSLWTSEVCTTSVQEAAPPLHTDYQERRTIEQQNDTFLPLFDLLISLTAFFSILPFIWPTPPPSYWSIDFKLQLVKYWLSDWPS